MISYFLNDTVDMLQFMMFNLSILHDFLQVIFLRICAGRGAEGRKSERTGCVMKILKECLDLLEFCWNCGYTMYLPKFQTLPKGQKNPRIIRYGDFLWCRQRESNPHTISSEGF